jgi:acetyl esterase/lipase
MEEDRSILSREAPAADLVVRYGPDPLHIADVRFADPPEAGCGRPLLAFVHGGFWRPTIDRVHTGPLACELAGAGWTVACIEYRRLPGQPELTVNDVALAVAALPVMPELTGCHDGRVIVAGHSAGGHLTLWAASCRPTDRLVAALALGPAADLVLADAQGLGDGATQAFLGAEGQERPDLDPTRMPSPQVPTTIIHGGFDSIVPIELSESYAAAHPMARLVRVPGDGHFGVIDPLSPTWPIVVAELVRLVREAPLASPDCG